MNFLKRFFNKHQSVPKFTVPENIAHNTKLLDDYGLNSLDFVLKSNDFGWTMPVKHKPVLLVNPKDCEGKINLMKLATLCSGTGHCEWEYILSCIFILKVITAIDNDSTY